MSSNPSADRIDLLVIGHVTEDRLSISPEPQAPSPARASTSESRIPPPATRHSELGGAAYAALTAHRLGALVGLLTSAGWEPGLVDTLDGLRVARVAAEETTRFENRYVDGRRVQRIEALAEPLAFEHLLPAWQRPPMVLIAPIAHEVEPDMVARFPHSEVVVSAQGWLRGWDRQGNVRPIKWKNARPVLEAADAVVLSEQDLANPADASRLADHARLLVVTRGPGGATVFHQGASLDSAAFQPERVVDPTGAGDAFAAAFLLKWHQTHDARASADYACCVASFLVEAPGLAAVPTPDRVDERLRTGARLPA